MLNFIIFEAARKASLCLAWNWLINRVVVADCFVFYFAGKKCCHFFWAIDSFDPITYEWGLDSMRRCIIRSSSKPKNPEISENLPRSVCWIILPHPDRFLFFIILLFLIPKKNLNLIFRPFRKRLHSFCNERLWRAQFLHRPINHNQFSQHSKRKKFATKHGFLKMKKKALKPRTIAFPLSLIENTNHIVGL